MDVSDGIFEAILSFAPTYYFQILATNSMCILINK